MGNKTGQLFRKKDVDDKSLEALHIPQLRSSTITAKDTVIIGDLTIFSRKILGTGFFGTVFEGQWSQKPCAVKVLSPLGQEFLTGLPITTQQDNVQEEALLKFKQECDFMKSYEHPNIVAYYSTVFYPECNLPVLVMELMQTSLRRYIHEDAVISKRIQLSLSCDIASALEFLHDKGLVHRDLCGDNILLNYNQDIPVAKVSDFGISRIIVKTEQLSHSLTALGHRPGYLPPEAFSIDPTDYDSSLDIFMFGVVMTQIASNVPTVDSYHQRQKLVSQLDQYSLKPFICQCLNENREERPSASTLLPLLKALRSKEECPSIGSSRNTPCKSQSWENELDNSTVMDECRGVTPSRGIHRRNTNDSDCGSLIERSMEEQTQNGISSSSQYIHQEMEQISTIRSQLYRSHSESKFLQGDAAVGARQANYRPRRRSSKQKQVTSSPQQKQQPTGDSNVSNHQTTSHSQPDMQRIGFESESPKQPRAISFRRLQQQQKLHYEHDFQDRVDVTQPFRVGYHHNIPEHLIKRHSESGAYMWPSLLHRPPIGDIFYKQDPWEQQDATMSNEENFANQKSLSRSNHNNIMLATSHVPHIASQEYSHTDHWTTSNTEDRALRNEFPDMNGHLFKVWLNKGKNGLLGLSITASKINQSLSGIFIMNIQKGGAAEENGEIKWGDVILKVNDTVVIGMSQQQFQELLANTSPNVRFVLLRQYGNSATTAGEGRGGAGGGAKPKVHMTTHNGISLEGLPQAQVVTLYCEDMRKGFGFQIENHEEFDSGVYKMIVSNITRGGAADASGQLQVGDWILSVDGTSTLGCAVQKASNLIQQGVSQGQVNLLIASRDYLSPLSPQFRNGYVGLGTVWGGEELLESTGHGEGDSRNRKKDIPEGILLKNKKKKVMRSLSPQRHSVGLDHHLYSNSWDEVDGIAHDDFQMGGADILSGGGVLNEATHNWSSHYSNHGLYAQKAREPFFVPDAGSNSEISYRRNSSDLLNQKGDFNLDMSRSMPGHNTRKKTIYLHRGPLGLGFSIVGGKGSVYGDLPIYIKQVFNEGAAGQDGRLKKGDQLLSVNGISFENVTHEFAAETLKYLQGDITLEAISND